MNKFIEVINDMVEFITGDRPDSDDELVRARDEMGRYIGDDPATKDVNEAWVSLFPTPKPSMKWTRKQLNDYCNEFGVLHSSYDNKKQLLKKISETHPNGI